MGREGYILRAYRDFCAIEGFTPAEPCLWTWKQAVAFRQGQRMRDEHDKAARLAARYFPRAEAPIPGPETPARRIIALERDVEALMRHRHQGPEREAKPQSKRGVKSVLDIGQDGKP